jgi:hypothetical protein
MFQICQKFNRVFCMTQVGDPQRATIYLELMTDTAR